MIDAGSFSYGKKIDDEIKKINEELDGIALQKKELVNQLGKVFEGKGIIKQASICTEIKKVLKNELEQELISTRLIELSCLDKWIKKTSLILKNFVLSKKGNVSGSQYFREYSYVSFQMNQKNRLETRMILHLPLFSTCFAVSGFLRGS